MSGEIDLLSKHMLLRMSGDPHRQPQNSSRDRERIFGVIALLLIGLLVWLVVVLSLIGLLMWIVVGRIGGLLT